MSRDEWFKEVPHTEDEDDPVAFIIEQMDQGEGLDIWAHADALRWLVREARHTHRLVLSDFLRRSSAEGSEWRPHRELEKNLDPDEPEVPYDYGDEAGEGFQDWDDWWRECWGKGRGHPKWFRERDPDNPEGWVATKIPKPPLVAIYHLVNWWWRRALRVAFRPDFDPWRDYQLESKKTGERDLTIVKAMNYLNPAARLLVLVAQEVNPQYTIDLCKKVHDDYYRHLDTRIE